MALAIVERLRQTAASETEDIAQGRPVPYEAYSHHPGYFNGLWL